MLNRDQIIFMQDYYEAIVLALDMNDTEFLEVLVMSPEYQDVFGDIPLQEVLISYQEMGFQ